MDIQARIRKARRHAGLSQLALAQKVGVQRSAVSHWEAVQGKNPSVMHLRAVAVITNTQFEWLATGRGAMILSRDIELDSIAVADASLVDDPLELRMLQAFREAPVRARIALVELAEELAQQRIGRARLRRPRQPE